MVRRMIVGLVAWVGVTGLVGCGGGGDAGISPRAACEDAQANLCERFYACYTPAEIAAIGFPSSEAACVTMLQSASGCEKQTAANACVGNEKFHPDQANLCVDQITGLACSQVRDPDLVLERAAPACGKVCAID